MVILFMFFPKERFRITKVLFNAIVQQGVCNFEQTTPMYTDLVENSVTRNAKHVYHRHSVLCKYIVQSAE